MLVVLGILAGFVGFLPLFLSMRLQRRSSSTEALTVGLYGLAGVCISLIVLIVALLLAAVNARSQLLSFAVPEIVVFLAITIVFFVTKNLRAKRRKRVQ